MAYQRKERPGFLFQHKNRVVLELLDDEDRGKLITALLDFSERGEKPNFDGKLQMAFAIISEQIEHDAKVYEQRCQQNSNNRASKETSDNDGKRPSTSINDDDQTKLNQSQTKLNQTQKGGYRGGSDFSRDSTGNDSCGNGWMPF